MRGQVYRQPGATNLSGLVRDAICNDYHITIHVGSQLSVLRLAGYSTASTQYNPRDVFQALQLD